MKACTHCAIICIWRFLWRHLTTQEEREANGHISCREELSQVNVLPVSDLTADAPPTSTLSPEAVDAWGRPAIVCSTHDNIESPGAAAAVACDGSSGNAPGITPSAPGVDPNAPGNARITLHEVELTRHAALLAAHCPARQPALLAASYAGSLLAAIRPATRTLPSMPATGYRTC